MNREVGNEKVAALIKLVLGIVFIVILVVISGINDNNNNNINYPEDNKITIDESNKITFEDKLAKLDNNYKYKYEIKIGDNLYIYNGAKKDNRESGTLLNNEETIYYFLENGYVYQVNNGGLDKIETIYDKNINPELLDINKIKELIVDAEYTLTENKYTYVIEDKTINIFTTDTDIEKIEIIHSDYSYLLEFNNIGKVDNITY